MLMGREDTLGPSSKAGGLGLAYPTSIAIHEYDTSREITASMVQSIINHSAKILLQKTPPSMTSRERRKSNRRASLQGSMMPVSHQVGDYWTVPVNRAPLHGCQLYLWRSTAFVSARTHSEMPSVCGLAGNCRT